MRKKEWFADDSFWRDLYPYIFSEKRFSDAAEQVDRLLALTKPLGKSVLDLCCGPGRWAIPLAQRRFLVTGVDRAKFLLDKAKAKARSGSLKIEWVQEDMRDFVRPESFDLALSLFSSFGYFHDKQEDLRVLRNMFASLRPRGVCLIDLAGKEVLAKILQPTTVEALSDGSQVVERHEIIDEWTRVHNEWTLIRKGRAKTFRFDITIYSGQELKDRMTAAGFVDVKLYGSLDGTEYGPNGQRLIAVGRKPAIQRRHH
jgi:SAM-dependent methyltransferase